MRAPGWARHSSRCCIFRQLSTPRGVGQLTPCDTDEELPRYPNLALVLEMHLYGPSRFARSELLSRRAEVMMSVVCLAELKTRPPTGSSCNFFQKKTSPMGTRSVLSVGHGAEITKYKWLFCLVTSPRLHPFWFWQCVTNNASIYQKYIPPFWGLRLQSGAAGPVIFCVRCGE